MKKLFIKVYLWILSIFKKMSTKETLKVNTENLNNVFASLTKELELRPWITVIKKEENRIEFVIVSDYFTLTIVRKNKDLYAYTHKIQRNDLDLNEKSKWVYQPDLDITIYANGDAILLKQHFITKKAAIRENTIPLTTLSNFGEDYFDVIESII